MIDPSDNFEIFGVEPDPRRAGSASVSHFGAGATWSDALGLAVNSPTRWAVIVAPETILNHSFAVEVQDAVADAGLAGIAWVAQFSNGIDVTGESIDCGNYLESPAIPMRSPLRIASSGRPAIALLDLSRLPNPLPETPSQLIEMAASRHRPVYLTSSLRYSSLGSPRADAGRVDVQLGNVDLRRLRSDPTISIVVRSTAGRGHFLRRNLDALGPQVSDAVAEVIVVSSEPIDGVRSQLASFDSAGLLPITVIEAPGTPVPSRTASLTHAIERARGDYVWFVDDDDWAAPDAVEKITAAVHANDRPIIVAAVESVTEQWDGTELRAAVTTRRYLPREWFRAFTGWNHLPNCALVFPTGLCRDRLAATPIVRDLGEDYALQLIMYSAPGATVTVTDSTVARVSIRSGGDSTVTMVDRTPWLRDIGSHISDLSRDPVVSNAALWAMGAAVRDIPYPEEGDGTELDQQAANAAKEASRDTPPRSLIRTLWSRLPRSERT